MAEAKKDNFWGDFAKTVGGAFAGPIGEMGAGMLASSLIKPNKNPFYAQQQADYAQKRRLNKYYDKYLSDQQDMYNKYNPVYQKTTDMAIEGANKPLTSTDTFKGVGPLNEMMNTQAQQSSAAANRVANNAGLYGGARTGLTNSVTNANNAAITKSLSDFTSNYEANAPARMASAQNMAAGAYGNASQGMLGAIGGLNQQYSDLIGTGQALGQQQLNAQNEQQQRQTALMTMLGDMFENKNTQQMYNKQFKQTQQNFDRQMAMYNPTNGGSSYTPSANSGAIGSNFPPGQFGFQRPTQLSGSMTPSFNPSASGIGGGQSIQQQIAQNRRFGMPTYQNGVMVDRGY
jgi:hypothetical protein